MDEIIEGWLYCVFNGQYEFYKISKETAQYWFIKSNNFKISKFSGRLCGITAAVHVDEVTYQPLTREIAEREGFTEWKK